MKINYSAWNIFPASRHCNGILCVITVTFPKFDLFDRKSIFEWNTISASRQYNAILCMSAVTTRLNVLSQLHQLTTRYHKRMKESYTTHVLSVGRLLQYSSKNKPRYSHFYYVLWTSMRRDLTSVSRVHINLKVVVTKTF